MRQSLMILGAQSRGAVLGSPSASADPADLSVRETVEREAQLDDAGGDAHYATSLFMPSDCICRASFERKRMNLLRALRTEAEGTRAPLLRHGGDPMHPARACFYVIVILMKSLVCNLCYPTTICIRETTAMLSQCLCMDAIKPK